MARPSRRTRLDTYQEEITRAKTWRRDNFYDQLWRRMAALYAGDFLPPSVEDSMKVNLAFSTVNVIVPSVALNHPKVTVIARTPENEDRAVYSEQVVNYWWKHHNFHKPFSAAVKDSVIYGFGWAKVGWAYLEEAVPMSEEELEAAFQEAMVQQEEALIRDPEIRGSLPSPEDVFNSLPSTVDVPIEDRPFVSRVSPHDVYVNPEATSMDDIRWIAQRILMRRDLLEKDRRYSATARKEAQGGIAEEDWDDPRLAEWDRFKSDEWVVVWEFYDLEKREMSTFTDGGERFLQEPRAIPYAYGHPFQMLRNYDVPEKFYPKGDLEEIEDFVLEISMTRSQMLQWRQKYATKYLIRDGAIDAGDLDKLTNRRDGQLIPVKDDNIDLNDVVVPVPINTLDPRLFDWSSQIQADVNEVSGVSEFARGTGAGSTQTATEATLIADASNARSQAKLTAVEHFISQIARKLQQLGQQFLTGEQFVRVVGKDGEALFMPYTRADISGEFDFEVESGSTAPQNDTYRRQQGIALMQTMAPFLEMGVMDPLRLAEHVMRESFGIRNAAKFFVPQANEMLAQRAQAEAQAQAQAGTAPGQPPPPGAQPGGQSGALAAPGNGVGLDAPQPTAADRGDMNDSAQNAAVAF